MEISECVKASTLEEVNLGMLNDPHTVSITKELKSFDKATMIVLRKEYQDISTWSHEDMKGLNPKFYQHQIHINKDATLVHQR